MGLGFSSEPESEDNDQALVDVKKLSTRIGALPVAGRYVAHRSLFDDYALEERIIGTGMSGPVRLATDLLNGRRYAVKAFDKPSLTSRGREQLKNEVDINLQLDHPNVVRLERVIECDDQLFLVMEYMAGGELYTRLAARGHYEERAASAALRQMFLAVAYLHAKGVVHRDLKLENFLYESEDSEHLKLIDFGLSGLLSGDCKMEHLCGSLHYVAPEVLEQSYSEKADCWSLGILTYMVLVGSAPFNGSNDDIVAGISTCKPNLSARYDSLSSVAQDFISKLLVKDVSHRLSAVEALQHEFLQESCNTVATVVDPEMLGSLISCARASPFRRACYKMMSWWLPAQQQTNLRKMFVAMDKEHKGIVSRQLFKQALLKQRVADAEADFILSRLASEDDGLLFNDFLAAFAHGSLTEDDVVLQQCFSRFDLDQGGVITADNIRCVLGDMFSGPELRNLMSHADGEPGVSYDAFSSYFKAAETDTQNGPSADPRPYFTPRTSAATRRYFTPRKTRARRDTDYGFSLIEPVLVGGGRLGRYSACASRVGRRAASDRCIRLRDPSRLRDTSTTARRGKKEAYAPEVRPQKLPAHCMTARTIQ